MKIINLHHYRVTLIFGWTNRFFSRSCQLFSGLNDLDGISDTLSPQSSALITFSLRLSVAKPPFDIRYSAVRF